jgi:hypothetical protein
MRGVLARCRGDDAPAAVVVVAPPSVEGIDLLPFLRIGGFAH